MPRGSARRGYVAAPDPGSMDTTAPPTPSPAANEPAPTSTSRARRVSFPGGTGTLEARSERPCTLRAGDLCVIERIDVEGRSYVRLGYERADRMRRGPLTMPADELSQLLETARRTGVLP